MFTKLLRAFSKLSSYVGSRAHELTVSYQIKFNTAIADNQKYIKAAPS